MIGGSLLRDQSSFLNLGDLSVLIHLCKEYENTHDSHKKRFYEQYRMTEREIQMLFSKKKELER
jgi:hypothetical protein